MKNLLFLLISILSINGIQSQTKHFENCGSSEVMENLFNKNPELLEHHNQLEKQSEEYLTSNTHQARGTQFTLPVVVHIIHENGPENLNESTILRGIEFLNHAFENIGYYNQNTGVDTEIQFCLARRSPDNQPSNGINKVQSPLTEFNYFFYDQTLKDLSRWNTNEYINIWVVKDICNSNGCSVLGYAYLPSAHGQSFDGIVIEADLFGNTEPNTSVLVHEMGHYLGLYHTFEEGCLNNDCMNQGDRVCDTPPDNTTARVPCPHPTNSCMTDTNSGFTTDQLDMKNNYMDYSNLECFNAFTEGQKERMFFFIQNVRNSLLDSKGCIDPCFLPVTANFEVAQTSIEVGQSLIFNNLSSNANDYTWKINGIPISNDVDLDYLFDQVGTFSFTLIAESNLPDCLSDSLRLNIAVDCNLDANFFTPTLSVAPGETISIRNLSRNASIFRWTVNSNVVGSSADYNFSENAEGLYVICLDASNNFCSENKCITVEVIGDPADDCPNSEIYQLGTNTLIENPTCMVIAPDGNLLMAGRAGTESFIAKINVKGDLIWAKSYDFSTLNDERISKLIIDSDGFLVGAGSGRTGSINTADGFIFKFDFNTENVIWMYRTPSSGPSYIFNDVQQLPNGNYLTGGQNFQNECDANFIEVDKNTGAKINSFNQQFDTGSCETFTSFLILNNGIITCGRNNYAGGGTSKMRSAHSFFDLDGNEIWTKSYLINLANNARLYLNDMLLENDKIFGVSFGTLSGTSLADSDIFFTQCDEDGRLEKAIQYDLPNTYIWPNKIYSTTDFFFVEVMDRTNERFVLLKLDKQGNLIYALRINEWRTEIHRGNSFVFAGDNIYLAKGFQNSTLDIQFFKIPIEGRPEFDDCIDYEYLNINQTTLQNPDESNSTLIKRNYNLNMSSVTLNPSNLALIKTEICNVPCVEDCENGVDDDGDGLVDCDDPDCPCDDQDFCIDMNLPDAIIELKNAFCENDSIEFELILCNVGKALLPQISIQFYLESPLRFSSSPIINIISEEEIPIDTCIETKLKIPNLQNGLIYALANADNNPPPPYDLNNDFPITSISECNYLNNIDSLDLNFVKNYWIEIGNDTSICPNQSFVISANSNLSNYRWMDGSTDSTYTIFEEGKYWCCVEDGCGNSACDTIFINYDENLQLDLGSDQEICEGILVNIQVVAPSSNKISWYPENKINCDTCRFNSVLPDVTTTYVVVGESAFGCITLDSITVTVNPTYSTLDTIQICKGDSIELNGETISQPGDLVQSFSTFKGCDSIFNYFITEQEDSIFNKEIINICKGDSVFIEGAFVFDNATFVQIGVSGNCVSVSETQVIVNPISLSFDTLTTCFGSEVNIFGAFTDQSGTFTENYPRLQLCDSIHSITLIAKDTFHSFESFEICSNESLDIFGSEINIPGIYSKTFIASNGCDSNSIMELIVNDTLETKEEISICEKDSIQIFGNFETQEGLYTQILQGINGCDSTHRINLIKTPEIQSVSNSTPTCFEDESGTAAIDISVGNPPFQYIWSNGLTDSILTNLSTGVYQFTVTDQSGCQKIDSVIVQNETFEVATNPIDPICFGDANGIIEIMTSNSDLEFSLNGLDFSSQQIFDNLSAGSYTVTIRNSSGCETSEDIEIIQPDLFIANLPNDTLINLGDSIQLNPSLNRRGIDFSWTPDLYLNCNDCPTVVSGPLGQTTYSVFITDEDGCISSDSITIRVSSDRAYYIPDIFSPNNDGINDFFMIYGDNTMERIIEFKLFDRWGELIWEGSNLTPNANEEGWNGYFRGKPMNSGVFAYYAILEFIDEVQIIVKGDVTLIR